MALTEKQRDIFDKQMNKLKEEGFFPIMKRQIPDGNRYLIISFGGTGIKTLLEIKKTLETNIDEVDNNGRRRDDYIRFLAIDTDDRDNKETVPITTQDGRSTTVEREKLDSVTKMQFFKLQGDGARSTILPEIDPAVKKWVNPDLVRIVENNIELLSGKGAGGYRQLGRLSLMSDNVRRAVIQKVKYHAEALTDNNSDHLNIMIVSGISGGTGSGTVIDLTYLIRHTIHGTQTDLTPRTTIGGFILLPPTGKPNADGDIEKGNANGYAALKEINHFMTISERRNTVNAAAPGAPRPVTLDDKYQLEYPGGFIVESTSNIFDVCYLMDGVRNGVALGANSGKVAAQVLGDCILDMICAQPVAAAQQGAQAYQAISSFMDDAHGNTQAMLRRISSANAHRDADYIYCSLGHSETLIPIDLMKSYVACKLFNVVLEHFNQSADASADYEEVKSFVSEAMRARDQIACVDKNVDEIFEDINKGPYYTVNFLYEAIKEIDRRLNVKLFGGNKEKLSNAGDYLNYLNHEIFEVYTAVMMSMKELLEKDYDVAIEGKYVDNTFTFSPIDLSNIQNGADAVKKYLDGLVQDGTTQQLAEDLLKDMVSNRKKWTELFNNLGQPGFDPAVAFRQFWNGWLKKIINSTLEDFLLKSTTGNPNAHYDVNATGQDAIARDANVALAASNIMQRMFGNAGRAYPMADFTLEKGLTADNFNPHKYIFVPYTAEHLFTAMQNLANAAANNGRVHVVPSYATDRISCYTQYTSIPAFKLAWVVKAEADYERDIHAVRLGLHMSETAGGRQWKNFPNLLPMSAWQADYDNIRERQIADMAQDVFKRAKELGLAIGVMPAVGASYLEYTVQFLPEAKRPEEQLYKTLDTETANQARYDNAKDVVDKAAENCAEALFNSVDSWLGKKATDILTGLNGGGQTRLVPSRSILDSGLGADQREDWSEYVAGTMLRKYPETLLAMRGTVDVMEKLKARVDMVNARAGMLKDFAKHVATGLLDYDTNIMSWAYVDAIGTQHPVGPVFARPELKLAEHYFVFEDYAAQYDSIKEVLEQPLKDCTTDPNPAINAQKLVALTNAGVTQANALKLRMNDPANPNQGIGSIVYANKPVMQDKNIEAIRDFYEKLIFEMQRL